MSEGSKSAMDGGFGQYVPGFEFLQSLAGQGQGARPPLSSLGNWVAPTFNVEDLEKRIEELKAVQFWLDQNAKALAATIQALEVQKMTLSTLKTMNLSMGDVAQSLGAMVGMAGGVPAAAAPAPTAFAGLEIPPRTYGTPPAAVPPQVPEAAPAQATAAAPAAKRSGAKTESAPAAGAVDPMQWWGALTQQFQQIASTALQDASRQVVPGAGDSPVPGGAASTAQPVARKAPVRRPPAKKAAAKKRASPKAVAQPASARKAAAPQSMGGDWPMPTAFFQMPAFPGLGDPPPKKSAAAKAKSGSAQKPATKKSSAKAAPAARRR
jgi:hypothetical protein